jgi:hypothetical protein
VRGGVYRRADNLYQDSVSVEGFRVVGAAAIFAYDVWRDYMFLGSGSIRRAQ